jgi:exodeoxyribonuclease V alpha subunit
MAHELRGQIERITYTNEENGYTIARVRIPGERDLVTVVGNLTTPTPGEVIHMSGEWSNHPRYGRQFRIDRYRSLVPATVSGIERYLGSGLIKGIGPVMARRIVRAFGETTLDVIDNRIDELSRVQGIGKKRIAMIHRAWEDQKEIREVMIFLQAHGVSSAYATRIFKQYGKAAIQVVRDNPYRLATDIFGIGFVTADRIAQKLGFAKDSQVRVEAGILYVLNELAGEGNVYYPYEPLVEKCRDILEVSRDHVVRAFGTITLENRIVIEDLNEGTGPLLENHKEVYLARYHRAESSVAEGLKALMRAPSAVRRIDADKALAWVQENLSILLARRQVEAVRCALESKVLVITGGPGTGKTTIIHAVLRILGRLQLRIFLAAPTGRAAKRMTEASGFEARTIHRMLEFSLQKGGFQRNERHPLECDVLVVDEASMIDTVLMHHLMRAVPVNATLILVGDVDQLPSVGPGNVLRDIIDSGAVPVVTLNEIFRQARESKIIVNAHRIQQGVVPLLSPAAPDDDFHFIHQEDPDRVLRIVRELVRERIPARFQLDPLDDIQVLTPMHRGTVGAENLNKELQEALNPRGEVIVRGHRRFRVGDKVMQIRNDYDREVFNGDIGRIRLVDPESGEVVVDFDGRPVPYDPSDLDELVLAYAVSVHKSQGSEYPAVIIPVLTQHYVLLQRNLIYTAVTRGKRLVVMVGAAKALGIAVRNDRTEKRYSHLNRRLA